MLPTILCLLYFLIVGCAFTPRRFFQWEILPTFGFIFFILVASALNFLLPVTFKFAAIILGLFSVIIFLFRVIFIKNKRKLAFVFTKSFLIISSVYISISQIKIFFHRQFSSNNFDYFFGVQDGVYISSHSLAESSSGSTGLFLTGVDPQHGILLGRYGISYVVALLNLFRFGNPWLLGEEIYYLMIALIFGSVYGIVKRSTIMLQKTYSFVPYLIACLVLTSPLMLMQYQMFMFGQIAGLVLVFISYYLMLEKYDSMILILQGLILVGLYLVYPVLLLVWVVVIAFFLLIGFFEFEEDKNKHLIKSLKTGFVFLIAGSIVFGFKLSLMLNRLHSWFSLSGSKQGSALFSQLNTQLALPISLGFIHYPSRLHPSSLLFIFFAFFSLIFFVIQYLPILFGRNFGGYASHLSLTIVYAFCFVWFYFNKQTYNLVKVSTYLVPFLWLMFFISSYFLLLKIFQKGSRVAKIVLMISILAVLVFQFQVSSVLIKRSGIWTSFSQVPRNINASQLAQFDLKSSGLGIISPTAEEGWWIGPYLNNHLQTKMFILNSQSQAWENGFDVNCTLPNSLNSRKDFDFLTSSDYKDIVQSPYVAGSGLLQVGPYVSGPIRQIKSGLFLTGQGVFPPEFVNPHYQILGELSVLRWSTGHVCIVSKQNSSRNLTQTLSILVKPGPDFTGLSHSWKLNGYPPIEAILEPNMSYLLKFRDPGILNWHTLDLTTNGCSEKAFQFNVSKGRGDDRKLCFLVGDIHFE